MSAVLQRIIGPTPAPVDTSGLGSPLWFLPPPEAAGPPAPAAPVYEDFVPVVAVDPFFGTPSSTPRMAEPNPPSWLATVGEAITAVVQAVLPSSTPRMAEPNPPSWVVPAAVVPFGDTGITQTPLPVVPFGDTGITQTPVDFVPSVAPAPVAALPAAVPQSAAPNPPSWLAAVGDAVATVVEAVLPASTPRMAEPNPPSWVAPVAAPAPIFAPPLPELPPVATGGGAKPASFNENVCLRIPDGEGGWKYISVPEQYAGGYDGVQVGAKYCQGYRDEEILGTGGGSNPIDVPPSVLDPVVMDPLPVVATPAIVTPIPETPTTPQTPILEAVKQIFDSPLWFQAPPEAAGPPAPAETSTETTATPEKKPCKCHDGEKVNKLNWLLLILGVAALLRK